MRLFNRLLVFALGLVLAGVGFVTAVEASWTGLGYRFLWFRGQSWLHSLQTSTWSDRSVMVGGAIAAAFGLLLLVAELRPWSTRLVATTLGDEDLWLLQRRSAEQYLQRTVQGDVPRSPIKADLHANRRRWRLRLRAPAAGSTKSDLEAAGRRQLDKLGAPSGSKILVRTSGRSSES
jgi:hypothetical protein